jgi:hypothetical protein
MQWKPIANKYRKGTMKSTLQARIFFIIYFLLLSFEFKFIFDKTYASLVGSEIESETALPGIIFR